MDENKNNSDNFSSGFDSVSNIKNNNNETASSENSSKNNMGYTLSPEGNFYDNPPQNQASPETDNEEKEIKEKVESVARDFIPNGTYSYSAAKGNLPDSAVNEPVPDLGKDKEPEPTPHITLNDSTFNKPPKNEELEQQVYHKSPPKKGKKFSGATVVISVILSVVLGLGSGALGTYLMLEYKSGDGNKTSSQINTPQNVTNITVDETVNSTAEAVAKKSGPSVIGIRTTAAVTNFFFGTSETSEEGSGIIYTADGYIITNYHVIESAVESSDSKVEVFLPDNTDKAYEATVIGYNISSDLAVVKIEAANLAAIEFADSENLTVGQNVIAIGNPGGLEFIGSVSTGVISGLNRSITVGTGATMSLIQTDAAINPGNSGGALVNTNGQLIGVNSVKLVSEGYEGMGFAIPSNTVKEICDKIISRQNDPTPYIGIQISQNYTAAQLKKLGYPAGAVVVSVVDGSPAADAGIKRGDIITEYNGKTIENYTELDDAISDSKPGHSVTVKLYRAGRFYSTSINVEANNAH